MANIKIKVSKPMYAAAKAYNLAGTGVEWCNKHL